MRIVGLCGVAKSGKDTFYKISSQLLDERGIKHARVSLADGIRDELEPFLLKSVNVSAFTSCSIEKEHIRDLFVSWAVTRRSIEKDYWIKKAKSKLITNGINFITDVRYRNEIDYIKREGGVVLFLKRKLPTGENLKPVNAEECANTVPLEGFVDHVVEWDTVGECFEPLTKIVLNTLCTYANLPPSF